MLIATVDSLENYKVERYFGLVTEQVVIGTWLFSELKAGFTDLFGGFSDGYGDKLSEIKSEVLKRLELRAQRLGANAILGVLIDVDEVSGGGKQMFMVTASGTAVVADISEESIVTEDRVLPSLSRDSLSRWSKLSRRISDAQQGTYASSAIFDISENYTDLLRADHLVSIMEAVLSEKNPEILIDHLKKILQRTRANEASAAFYSTILGYPYDKVRQLCHGLKECAIMDAGSTASLLASDDIEKSKLGVCTLLLSQPIYSFEDIEALEKICGLLVQKFPVAEESKSKKGRWDCKCGFQPKLADDQCKQCGKNKWGLKVIEIDSLVNRLEGQIGGLKFYYGVEAPSINPDAGF